MKKLTKKEQEIFQDCQGNCSGCYFDGGCDLQSKIKEEENATIN